MVGWKPQPSSSSLNVLTSAVWSEPRVSAGKWRTDGGRKPSLGAIYQGVSLRRELGED